MPRKKNSSTAQRYIKKGMSIAQTAGKALAIAESVAGLLNTEMKMVEQFIAPTFSQAGQLTAFTMPGQGDGSSQRIGDQFRLKRIESKGYLEMHGSATHTFARIILLREVSPCGTDLTVANVLHNTNGTSLSSADAPFLFYERDGRQRFKVISDKTYHLETGTNELIPLRFTKSYKKGPIVEFDSGGAVITRNKFYYLVITDEPTNVPSARWLLRYHYVDN